MLPLLSLAEVAIIVYPSNSAEISQESTKALYLGRKRNFAPSKEAIPLKLNEGEEHQMITAGLRYNFYPNTSLKLQCDDFKDEDE